MLSHHRARSSRTAKSPADRAEPGQGHAVRVVAQPLHGLRPPVHVLLRPGFERPADGPPTTATDAHPGQGERRRRPRARARAALLGREEVTIGAATDPYQPAEGRYRLTRACLASSGGPGRRSRSSRAARCVARRRRPAGAARRAARLGQRVGADPRRPRLAHDGARDGAAAAPARDRPSARRRRHPDERRVAPILPGLSDAPEQLAETVRAARAAGAHHIWANMLNLRPGTREHFLEALARDWPEERAATKALTGRSYLPERETLPVRDRVRRSPASRRERRPPCGRAPSRRS